MNTVIKIHHKIGNQHKLRTTSVHKHLAHFAEIVIKKINIVLLKAL